MRIGPSINPIMESLILQKIKLEYATMIPKDVIANLTVEQIMDFEMKALKTFFRTFIPGREIRKETVRKIIVYQSWWDHLKAVHFPKWFKARFPVKCKYEPVEIRHIHICPHTGIALRGNEQEMHWTFLKGEEPEDWMKPFIKIADGNLPHNRESGDNS
jgi:hypothetical protein